MVKNVKGGSGHKSQARKFVAPKASSKTRLVTEEGEQYAYVTNKSGGENCVVICQDDTLRRCVIRGKFRSSRGKRDNFITKGTWVLVGIRDWASSANAVCDLLEVYKENDKTKLKTIPGVNWSKFISHDMECSNSTSKELSGGYEDDSFEFSSISSTENEYAQLVATSKSTITLQTINEEFNTTAYTEIDLDDI